MNQPNQYSSRSFFLKVVLIFLLFLVLGIPSIRLSILVEQRQNRNNAVQRELSESWGAAQQITGPILRIPYSSKEINAEGESYYEDHELFITPDSVQLDMDQATQTRKRGIYEALLYELDMRCQARFTIQINDIIDTTDNEIDWSGSELYMGITDPTAIIEISQAQWGDRDISFERGIPRSTIGLLSGIHAQALKINSETATIDFTLDMRLRGSEELTINPVAADTRWELRSDWHSPSFIGSALPAAREVSDAGFSSSWQLTKFARALPATWSDDEYTLDRRARQFIGVRLLNPINPYAKTKRAINYSMLIIGLTFLLYFLNEIINRKKFHPIQYALVGLALCLFYLMLLSFSEHLGFDLAYVIASGMIILLVSWYSWMALKNKKLTGMVAGELTLLYIYIFFLLQLEDYALLVGSVGLFVILATVMYLTRDIDWYQDSLTNEKA